jgi:two-component system OmpR family sensor kinase
MTNQQRRDTDSHMHRDKISLQLFIHDLKVPLAVIEAGITSLLGKLEKYGPLTEKQEKVLQRTLRNTRVIQALVNDSLELERSKRGVLNISRTRVSGLIEEALVEIFDLVDSQASESIKCCEDLHQLQGALDENGLKLFIDEALWCTELSLDEAKIRQILRNLLNNALKYRKTCVEFRVEKQSHQLCFSVKDDGEGIPSSYHKRIFESYFQMNATDTYTVRGHGLGLAGVMVLVEDMGGELCLESDEGKGAEFRVKLPLPKAK